MYDDGDAARLHVGVHIMMMMMWHTSDCHVKDTTGDILLKICVSAVRTSVSNSRVSPVIVTQSTCSIRTLDFIRLEALLV